MSLAWICENCPKVKRLSLFKGISDFFGLPGQKPDLSSTPGVKGLVIPVNSLHFRQYLFKSKRPFWFQIMFWNIRKVTWRFKALKKKGKSPRLDNLTFVEVHPYLIAIDANRELIYSTGPLPDSPFKIHHKVSQSFINFSSFDPHAFCFRSSWAISWTCIKHFLTHSCWLIQSSSTDLKIFKNVGFEICSFISSFIKLNQPAFTANTLVWVKEPEISVVTINKLKFVPPTSQKAYKYT